MPRLLCTSWMSRLAAVSVFMTTLVTSGCSRDECHWQATDLTFASNGVRYNVQYASYDGGVALVHALAGEGTSGFVDQGPPPTGWMSRGDRQVIAWTCESKDGRTGAITVNNVALDLANGPLVLHRAEADGSASFDQCAVDVSKLDFARFAESLRSLAGSDPKVAAFLARK